MELVIYIPGLGGESTLSRQRKIVSEWKSDRRDSVFLEARWRDKNEDFKTKLKRLIGEVSALNLSDYSKVTFLGTSAGGTLGLNIFNEFLDSDNTNFIAIAGKIVGPHLIGRPYSEPHPALIPSVNYSEDIIKNELKIDRQARIKTVIPLFDEIVNKKCMRIEGANHMRQWTIGHIPSIGLGITLFKNRYI